MAVFLAPIINSQQVDNNGDPLSGGTIEVYLAGTSTPSTTYSDKAGLVPNTWPIVLNTLGVNNQGEVWVTGGASYKFIIKNSTGIVQRTLDNVSGINDSTIATDQWIVFQATPTYVSATSFTVVGDQTQIFQVGRRVRTQNTGGLVYSTIVSSVFSAGNTTVTVRNDSGVLDPGLSQVSYGIISIQNSSVAGLLLNIQVISVTGTYTPTPGTISIVVDGVGSGGGGAGSAATGVGTVSAGGGGGAGNVLKGFFSSGFTPSVAVTIASGGAGGGIGGAGTTGGDCIFGSLMTIKGGAGGSSGAAGAVSAGSGSGSVAGSTGGNIYSVSGAPGGIGWGSNAAGLIVSGIGGSSPFGGGAISTSTNLAGNSGGNPAGGRGAGGSGGATGNSQGGAGGGAGSAGLFIVYEYA